MLGLYRPSQAPEGTRNSCLISLLISQESHKKVRSHLAPTKWEFNWFPTSLRKKSVRESGVSTGSRLTPTPFAYFSNLDPDQIQSLTRGPKPRETTCNYLIYSIILSKLLATEPPSRCFKFLLTFCVGYHSNSARDNCSSSRLATIAAKSD